MNDAGRFMILPQGEYDANITYQRFDSVTYAGNAYIAIKETTGNLPTDTNYWKIFVKGANVTPQYTVADEVSELTSGEDINTAFGKIAKAIKDYIAHIVTKATNTVLGHVKVTDSSAVTDSTGLALAATEKNASIEGTLAHQIDVINSNLRSAKIGTNVFNGSVIVPANQANDVEIPFLQNIYSSDMTDFLIVQFISASLEGQAQSWIINRANIGMSIAMISISDNTAPSRLRYLWKDDRYTTMTLRNYTNADIEIIRVDWYHST